VVETATAETYLQHADRNQPDLDLEEGLLHVGRLINKIKTCNDIEFEIAFRSGNPDLVRNLDHEREELCALVDTLPDPERLNEITLTCDPDIFLEILMGNIRNSLISFQAWMIKVRNARKNNLTLSLYRLKQDYKINCDLIFDLERELTGIRDEELSAQINELKLFEHLHNEKPSPLFLNLIRCRNRETLSGIVKDDGTPFSLKKERDEHIVSSFAKTYLGRASDPDINYDTCIQQFLGDEICNHPVVQHSKLTDPEQIMLDSPLTLNELDDSLNNCNIRSAAGNDRFSNKLIKLCWKSLRLPLYNYAIHCFNTGILTHNFRSANIKLIPKKGDGKFLKNWRPISLLSNMYKIISRAINNRLNKVVNRVCSRAQKGYNSCRYTQEVLVNVCETIAYCRNTGTRGAILAVDMAKAFNTLDHKFISVVYKFFGFGENIIR
jgi:hypothetical protein